MRILKFIGCLLALTNMSIAQLSPTADQVLEMRAALEQHIEAQTGQGGGHPRIGGLVRLAFHDCVGGCDGCVNLANPDNDGLRPYIRDLEDVYANFEGIISRADFWQLAGLEALERAAGTDRPDIPFLVGRIDCSTSPDTSDVEAFPTNGGHGNLGNVLDFFQSGFNLGERDAVAILGAHTLGRARTGASGFNGPWVRNEDLFDNAYYRDLLDENLMWIQTNINPTGEDRWQWVHGRAGGRRGKRQAGGGGPMMLNSDMCLVKDITADSDGRSSCNYFSCADSPTFSIVEEYANNNALWVSEYSRAHTIMTSNGYGEGDLASVAEAIMVGNPEEQPLNTDEEAEEEELIEVIDAIMTGGTNEGEQPPRGGSGGRRGSGLRRGGPGRGGAGGRRRQR
ncbi:unnamed protein product [Owenia fusiformis]|uniref:Uncharacterized protein n=1 Tax=Owenia fusiformis TaxID=6347 RepID=A0A8J1T6Q9_OWEFU|nr:unnamed protein product [Owenia fusiformis]